MNFLIITLVTKDKKERKIVIQPSHSRGLAGFVSWHLLASFAFSCKHNNKGKVHLHEKFYCQCQWCLHMIFSCCGTSLSESFTLSLLLDYILFLLFTLYYIILHTLHWQWLTDWTLFSGFICRLFFPCAPSYTYTCLYIISIDRAKSNNWDAGRIQNAKWKRKNEKWQIEKTSVRIQVDILTNCTDEEEVRRKK